MSDTDLYLSKKGKYSEQGTVRASGDKNRFNSLLKNYNFLNNLNSVSKKDDAFLLINDNLPDVRVEVGGGHVSSFYTTILYKQWVSFCTDVQTNHMLQDLGVPTIKIIQVYGHQVRHGYYSK